MAKKEKTPSQLFELTLNSSNPVETYEGKVVTRDENGIVFRHKKWRSKKYIERHLTYSQILFLTGDESTESATVGVRVQTAEIYSTQVSAITDVGNGLLAGVDGDGTPVMYRAELADVQVEADDEPKASKPAKTSDGDKKSKKKSKPSKKVSWDQ